MKTLLFKPPWTIYLRPRAVLESRTLKIVCNLAPVMDYDVFRSASGLRGSNLVDPYRCFNRTTCTRGYTPESHSPNPEVSEIRPSFEIKFLGFFLFWEVVSLSTCSNPLTRTLELCVDGHAKVHPLHQSNSAPPFRSKLCHQYTSLHHCGRRSRLILFHLHPLQRFHLAFSVWAHADAQRACN